MEPVASRPYMPDYGTLPADQGTGLLPWAWAIERLTASHDYWVATTWPDHRPHVSPVWGIWMDDAVWFSCGPRSRKARNIAGDPRCAITTDNALEPVIVEGSAALALEAAAAFTAAVNAKYEVDYPVSFFDENHLYRVTPAVVFGLAESDFEGSPTRWAFMQS